ncbi:alpha-glucosidase [Saonia flava]|uniref:Alpha-glucosidase n=1 Tax=Saonia flava TaxID=523696 RepID=A0A846QP32_9FLAO|nr:glycoside hydrolase family 97 protein [Saonia flava]NJB69878.1 alpha-glucosidase [Saonia flava]
MNKNIKTIWVLLLCLCCNTSYLFSQDYELNSFDGNLKIMVDVVPKLNWSVSYKGNLIIDKSEIALELDNGTILGHSSIVKKAVETFSDTSINPVIAQKNAVIQDKYKQLALNFKNGFSVEFRAYNDGVGYRFLTNLGKEITIKNEVADLNFSNTTTSLFPEEESLISHYERSYIPTKLDTLGHAKFASLPTLLEVGDVKIVVTESDLYDYPGMFLYGTKGNGLTAGFPKAVKEASPAPGAEDRNQVIVPEDYIAKTSGKRSFPWRAFVISDDDKQLLESELVYKLARPLQLKNTAWIKPGKVAWDWYNANNIYGVDFKSGDNTNTYKYYIDFASKHGIEYIILDEGWSKTTTNILESNPEINIQELVNYGKDKNVGIILWSLWKPIDDHLNEALELYKNWGIKGVKIDFMQRADQQMVNYYERVVKEAAKNELLVDYHGAYKPSGLRRAYPNMISYEGVKGNENNKWSADVSPEHTVTLPFTRMVAGPMDFTPGAMINAQQGNYADIFARPMSLGTRCHQIAMYVIYESPLQMLCDSPSNYEKELETTEFISKMPTTWDQTIALNAKVGDYVVMARRKGDAWYIGGMTDWSPREIEIDFSFLPDGDYNAEIMKDGINADRYAQDYKKENININSSTKTRIRMAPGGGWAAIVTKQ